jgi:hypothetical protein
MGRRHELTEEQIVHALKRADARLSSSDAIGVSSIRSSSCCSSSVKKS